MKFVSVDPLPLRFTAGNMIKYCARGCLDEGLSKFWGSFPCCKAIKSADNIMPFTRKKKKHFYQRLLSYLEVLKDLFISVKTKKKVKVCGRQKKVVFLGFFFNHYKSPQKRRGKGGGGQQQRIKKKDQGRHGYFKSWVISNLCIFPFNIPPDPNAHREQAVHCDQHIRPIAFPSPRRLHAASPLNELIGEQWIPEVCSAHPGSRDASDLHTRQKLDHASKTKQRYVLSEVKCLKLI